MMTGSWKVSMHTGLHMTQHVTWQLDRLGYAKLTKSKVSLPNPDELP